MTSNGSRLNKYSQAVNRLAAAYVMLKQAEEVGIDFAIVEAQLNVEEAEIALDRLAEPDPAFVW
jgi:uncharacterized protein YmfQ (DUF2313 family)